MLYRLGTQRDNDALKNLWTQCFTDPQPFVDWFFSVRYKSGLCALCEENGKLLGAMHGYIFDVNVRKRTLKCAMISGVSTIPEARGKGVMRGTMDFFFRTLKQDFGCTAAFFTPADFAVYEHLGYYPTNAMLNVNVFSVSEKLDTSAKVLNSFDSNALLKVYNEGIAGRFSGAVIRTAHDFALRLGDFAAGNMLLAVSESRGALDGYAYFSSSADKLVLEEVAWLNEEAPQQLLRAALLHSPGKPLEAKLPPDTPVSAFNGLNYTLETVPRGIMAPLDTGRFIEKLAPETDLLFDIYDGLTLARDGIFNWRGERMKNARENKTVRLGTGQLAVWLTGFSTLFPSLSAPAFGSDGISLPPVDNVLPCYTSDDY